MPAMQRNSLRKTFCGTGFFSGISFKSSRPDAGESRDARRIGNEKLQRRK
ncbi:hypothetical protein PA01_18525 [Azoarcus sp. PA01]|nr:hypothetical protein PA01_18525 [Azoarcus sp. PA01]